MLCLAAGTRFDEPRALEVIRFMLAMPTQWITARRLTAVGAVAPRRRVAITPASMARG